MRLFEIEDAIADKIRKLAATPVELPLQEPGGFTVVLLNDHVTPAEVVIEAVMAATGFSESKAVERVMAAHTGRLVSNRNLLVTAILRKRWQITLCVTLNRILIMIIIEE